MIELEFELNHSIKSKCLKWIVKTILPDYKEWKTHNQNKTDKNWERDWNNVFLGCKDYTDNFKPQEIRMTNKVLREKSNCVVCQSSKSRFLKEKQKIIEQL